MHSQTDRALRGEEKEQMLDGAADLFGAGEKKSSEEELETQKDKLHAKIGQQVIYCKPRTSIPDNVPRYQRPCTILNLAPQWLDFRVHLRGKEA